MDVVPFAGNTGIGFNRRTWQAGNAIGRGMRPYIKMAVDKIRKYSNLQRAKRSLFKDKKRAVRGRPFVAARGAQIEGAGGESHFYFTKFNPRIKSSALGFLGKNTVGRSSGFSTASTQGLQNATMLGTYWGAADVINAFTAVGETTATAAYRAAKAVLLGLTAKAVIVNAENTNVHFDIYDVLCRTDSATNNPDPASTFLAGNVDANGGAAADATIPGTTPYSNPRFVASYKILQKTTVVLHGGGIHTHNVRYDVNKIQSLEKIYTSGLSAGGLAGLTICSFIVQYGSPVHDGTTETSVTLGKSKLDIVLMEELYFKQSIRDYSFNGLSTTLATNLTGEQMVRDNPVDQTDES